MQINTARAVFTTLASMSSATVRQADDRLLETSLIDWLLSILRTFPTTGTPLLVLTGTRMIFSMISIAPRVDQGPWPSRHEYEMKLHSDSKRLHARTCRISTTNKNEFVNERVGEDIFFCY